MAEKRRHRSSENAHQKLKPGSARTSGHTKKTLSKASPGTEESIRLLFVEDTTGEQYECRVPWGTRIEQIASDFFESQGWGTHDARGRVQRAVVELVDRDHPDRTLRLNGEDTVRDAGLNDSDILRVFPESVAGCFLGDARVTLANGQLMPIAQVQIGDILVSGIPGSNQKEETTIIEIYRSSTQSYIIINNKLNITSTHPVWANGRWIIAGALQVGDHLQGIDATVLKIESLQHKANKASVWNLYVSSKAHTFYAEGILVHNMNYKVALSEVTEKSAEYKTILENLLNGMTFSNFGFAGQFSHVKAERQTVMVEMRLDESIEKFDAERQSQFIRQIEEKTSFDVENIQIGVSPKGGVLLIFEMPKYTAFILLDLYLQGSQLRKSYGLQTSNYAHFIRNQKRLLC